LIGDGEDGESVDTCPEFTTEAQRTQRKEGEERILIGGQLDSERLGFTTEAQRTQRKEGEERI
jgi:hypothetical protein